MKTRLHTSVWNTYSGVLCVALILTAAVPSTVYGQWTTQGDVVHTTDSNAKVGIGTASPIAKLDVNGAIQANNHTTHMGWYNLWTAPQGAWVPGYMKLITPIDLSAHNMFSIHIKGYRYGTGGTPVEIRCGGYAYPNINQLIARDCHTEGTNDPVGIDVEGGFVVITVGSGASSWYYDHFTAEYSGWQRKRAEDFIWEFVHNTAPNTTNLNNVYIDDSNGTIQTTGDVGVGTAAPQQRLHVKGNGIRVEEEVQGRAVEILAPVNGVNTRFHNHATGSGFVFQNDASDALMVVQGDGNVGIGTATPSDKLAVQGTVRAQEVVVTLDNWPDYVFDEAYPLLSLEEVEHFITVNKHLPGMPSEEEVKAKGGQLGEVQAKLLEKIEELTLHVISQNKQLKVQEQRFEQMAAENDELRQMLKQVMQQLQ